MPTPPTDSTTRSDERIYRAEFWLGPYDARRLAVFRIAATAVVLYDVLERLRDFYTFYTDRGILPRDRIFGASYMPDSLSLFMLVGSPVGVGVVWAVGCAALIALLVGFRTRWATFLSWAFVLSIQRRNTHILDGADLVESTLLFWMIWADCGADLSVDAWLRRKHSAAVDAFPVRLIQIQLAIVYFFTALEKSDVSWYGGAALGRILQLKEFARPVASWLLHFPSVLHYLSICVPPIEAGIAVLMMLPWRRARFAAVALSWSLHGSIFVLMNVGMFSLLMPAAMTIALPPRPVSTTSARRSPLRRWLPVSLMALTVASLIARPYDAKLPLPIVRVLYAAGISQQWPMFGQVPGLYDFTWRAEGERVDGTHTGDLVAALTPGLLHPARHLTYARWLKLAEALREPQMAREFAAYLCRRHNVDAAVPLKSLELVLVTRVITPFERGGPMRERETKMLHQECFGKIRSGGGGERRD